MKQARLLRTSRHSLTAEMRSAALKSRRLRSVTSARATRQLLLCYHRNPPSNQSAACCWLRLNCATTFQALERDGAFKSRSAQESRDTHADTSALSSSGFRRERNGMMHRTHHGRCCWCCRARRDVPTLWDHGKRTNTTRVTTDATIADSEENIIYVGKRSIVTTRCPRGMWMCAPVGHFKLKSFITIPRRSVQQHRAGWSACPVSAREMNTAEAQSSMLKSYWWRTNANTDLRLHPPPLEHLGSCIFSQTLVASYWQNQNN